MKDDRKSPDALEQNVAHLLSNIDPELAMPEDEAEKVLRSLAGGGDCAAGRARSRLRSLLAAAAIVLLAITTLLLMPRQGTVLWADVVAHLDGITSLSCGYVWEKRTDDGELEVESGHVFLKDPGKGRFEYGPQKTSGDGSDSQRSTARGVRISISDGNVSTFMNVFPEFRTIHISNDISRECGDAFRREPLHAAEVWRLLAEVRGASARVIGRRLVGEEWATGFEAVFGKFSTRAFKDTPADSIVRVWASEESAVPLAMEFEGGTFADGSAAGHVRFEPMAWNPDIDDALFTVEGFENYDIHESDSLTICFSKTALAPEVELILARVDGHPPLLTSADITSVELGIDRWDPRDPDTSLERRILLEVTEEGFEGVRSVLGFPRYDPLLVEFDGRPLRLHVGHYHDGAYRLELDITTLGLSLEDFEARYLE
jgi:outer membrane lipoprotein-sorting protein